MRAGTCGRAAQRQALRSRCSSARRSAAAARRATRVVAHAAAAPDQLQDSQAKLSDVDGGRAAVSAGPSEAGTTLFTIPESQLLRLATVEKSAVGEALKGQPAWLQLAVFLLHAEATGDTTWGSYLADFAAGPTPVTLWPESSLSDLQGTQLYGSASQYRAFFAQKHAEVQSSVAPSLDSATAAACTVERFTVAVAAVRARLLPPFTNKDPCIAIGAELVQHGRKANVKLKLKGGSLFDRASSLQVVATTALATDEPLYLDYAPGQLESQVALDHGVWDAARPDVGFMLTLQLPAEEEDTCHWDKVDILEQQELTPSQSFALRGGEAPPEEMMAFLRLMNIAGADAFLMEAIFRNEAWGHMLVPVSRENEENVCTSMAGGCEQAVAAYPTTLADDIRALDACTDARQRLALNTRMSEKRVLEATGEWFRRRGADLDNLEYYQERRLKRLGLLDDDGETTFEDMIQINM